MLRSANEWEDVEAVDLTDEQWALAGTADPYAATKAGPTRQTMAGREGSAGRSAMGA